MKCNIHVYLYVLTLELIDQFSIISDFILNWEHAVAQLVQALY
jgi:hypothetical protein